jgi:low affinity Fe/Cu permease
MSFRSLVASWRSLINRHAVAQTTGLRRVALALHVADSLWQLAVSTGLSVLTLIVVVLVKEAQVMDLGSSLSL